MTYDHEVAHKRPEEDSMKDHDLIPSGAQAAFADVLRPTGSREALARIQAMSRRQSDELPEQLALGSIDIEAEEVRGQHGDGGFRGSLSTPAKLRRYVLGGKGRITLVSRRTGARFTFRISAPRTPRENDCRLFVGLLTGPNNDSDYQYLGTMWTESSRYHGRVYPPAYRHGSRSQVREAAPSAQAARWLFDRILRGTDDDLAALLDQAEVWHEGVCGRCGRSLTVPDSVETGLGPVCAGKEA